MYGFQKIKGLINRFSLRKILILALILRLSWYLLILFTNPEGFWLYDSYGYWNIAYNVNEYGIFSRDEMEPLLPDYFRTPLYPLLILPTVWFDITGNTIPLIHILIDCLTCWLIYKIVFEITSKENYSKLAAMVYAIHIPAIAFSNFVLTESIFAFLITLFIFILLKLISNFGYKNALGLGLIGGLCVMCKPLGFILIFPTILFILVLKKINFNSIKVIILFTTVFYAVQLPWMQRNKNEFGRYFNSVLGEHLLLGYHASNVYAKANNISFNHAQEILRDAFVDDINYDPYKHPYEYAKLIEKESYKIFLSNKLLFIKEHAKECIKFFIQPMKGYLSWQLGKNHSYTTPIVISMVVIQLIFLLIIYSTILFCIFLFIKKRIVLGWAIFLLLTLLVLFSQFNTMPFTDARMRFPLDPIIIALFSLTLLKLTSRQSSV